MSFALAFFLPILALFALTQFRKPPERRDYVAERHRKITHRGFKTRAGIRS